MKSTRRASPKPDKPTANVAQLKARLSEYLRRVKAGEEVVITERGAPVAKLVPLDVEHRRATREERLIRAGVLRPPRGPRTKWDPPKGNPAEGTAVLEALLAEREEGW